MITLNNVSYRYPKKKEFSLKDISFSISPGAVFTLLGPNGAGKTTIIRILSGLIIPRQGSVSICGHDILYDEYKARRKIGLVLGDERTFYFRLSGAQNLAFFGGLYGLKSSNLRRKVIEVLDRVGLSEDAKLKYMYYSSGMKKRLSMARALLHEPEVLLLDEPNSGVDPYSARKIRELIFDLKTRNRTIFLTTHDMEEAEKMSDKVGFIKTGSLLKVGSIDEFKNDIDKRIFEVVFDKVFDSSHLHDVKILIDRLRNGLVVESAQFRDGILRICYNGSFDMLRAMEIISRCSFPVRETNTIQPNLEDVFMKLMETKDVL